MTADHFFPLALVRLLPGLIICLVGHSSMQCSPFAVHPGQNVLGVSDRNEDETGQTRRDKCYLVYDLTDQGQL